VTLRSTDEGDADRRAGKPERPREKLLRGTYRPRPVRRVEIPKPGGKGVRLLGIPRVLDRMIQQALHQVLQPIFDPTFADESYGLRPGRSALDAVERARPQRQRGRWEDLRL